MFIESSPSPLSHISIYKVHDEVKAKEFELELSWVGEGEYLYHAVIARVLEFSGLHWS